MAAYELPPPQEGVLQELARPQSARFIRHLGAFVVGEEVDQVHCCVFIVPAVSITLSLTCSCRQAPMSAATLAPSPLCDKRAYSTTLATIVHYNARKHKLACVTEKSVQKHALTSVRESVECRQSWYTDMLMQKIVLLICHLTRAFKPSTEHPAAVT